MRRSLVLSWCACCLAACTKPEGSAAPTEAGLVDAGSGFDAGTDAAADAAADAEAEVDAAPRTVDVFVEIVPTGREASLRLRIPEIHVDRTFFRFCGSAGLGCILAPHGSSTLFYYGTDMFEEWGAVRLCGSKVVVRLSTSLESARATTKTTVYRLPEGTVAEVHLRGERDARRLREVGSPADLTDPKCPR